MKKIAALLLVLILVLSVGLAGCNKTGNSANYVILDEALADEEYGIGFRKDDKALGQEVERILVEMKKDGTMAVITKDWFGSDTSIVDANKMATGATDDSLQKVKDRGFLVMGLDDSFPPMGYRDDNDNIAGYDIDLAKEVCKRMGVELKLQPISWSAKEMELDSGKIDCIWNGFTINEDRKAAHYMSLPYMVNRQVVVTLDNSGIEKLADLKGKTLIIQGGSSAGDALDSKPDVKDSLKNGAAVEVDNNVMAMFDLKVGESDAVLMDEVVARYYLSNPNEAE